LLVVFVPRTSSTPVATWFWQTEGRSAEHVILGSDRASSSCWSFNLLREEFFFGSHSLPPLWSPNRSFNWYQSWFGFLLTLASLRSKDGVPGMGFGFSTLRWKELLDVESADSGVPPRKGSDPLGCHGGHRLCPADELPCSRIKGHVRRQQQGSQLLVSCFVSA
jgi:hypothetical protein